MAGTLAVQSYATATGIVLGEVHVAPLSSSMKTALTNHLHTAILAFNSAQTAAGMERLRLVIDLINRRDRSFPSTLALRWIAAASRIRRARNPNL